MKDNLILTCLLFVSYTGFRFVTNSVLQSGTSAQISSLLLSVVFTLFVWYTIKGWMAERASKDFPGVSTHNLIWGLLTKKIPSDLISSMDRVHELRKKYGPMFKVRIGARIEIFVADAKIALQMLRKHMDRSETYSGAKGSFEKSVVHLDGKEHHRRRGVLGAVFNRETLKEVFPKIQDAAKQVIMDWKSEAEEKSIIRVDKGCSRLVLNGISHSGFDHEFKEGDDMGPDRLLEVISTLFTAHGLRMNLPKICWPFINLYERSTVSLWKIFLKERIINNLHAREKSVLGVMKKEYGTGNALLSEAHALFAAAHDTTLSTMNYILLRLAKYPKILQKVRKEVDGLEWNNDEITMEDTSSERLPYTHCVLKEVLRTDNPSGFGVQRGITNDNEVYGGYHFPKGACVTFLVDAFGNDPSFWDDPEEFRPERWEEPGSESKFVGFGYGPRSCIGRELATLEMILLMVYTVRHLELDLVPGKDPDTIHRIFVMASGAEGEVTVAMRPRKTEQNCR